MKKVLFSIALLSAGLASAQAVLEHSYLTTKWSWEKSNAFNTETGIHYYTTNSDNVMSIYDGSHFLIKTINLPIESNVDDYFIEAISDKLFNSDDLIEFVLWTRGEWNSGYDWTYRLINEDGVLLQNLGSGHGIDYENFIVKGANNDFKLIVMLSNYNGGDNLFYEVYSLPGTYLEVNTLVNNDNGYIYPNPAKTVINITNPKNGSNEMKIFNSTGQLIKSVSFSHEEKITVNINNLPKGVYFIKAGSMSSKFIKD